MARAGRRSLESPSGALPAAEPTPSAHAAELVRLGRIVGIHGLRGALRYRPDNPDSGALDEIDSVLIECGGQRRAFDLLSAAPIGRGMFKIEVSGIVDANGAEALKGGVVMVPPDRLPALSPREFYYFDAIGCQVVLTDGTAIGSIVEMFSNGANDVMVVKAGAREILVPVIEDVVKAIDLDARRVVVEPVPGLLE